MRILFLSSLYSTPALPDRSPGNTRILQAMRAYAEISVMAPVPYYPAALVRKRPALRALAEAPLSEVVGEDSPPVLHPRTLHVPFRGRRFYAGLFAASVFVPLAREARRFRPDVLLSAWAYPDGTAAVLLARLLGLPSVVRAMGSDINDHAHRPGKRGQIAWAMRSATRVVAVSAALGDAVAGLGVPKERIVTIPTGVDGRRFHPRDRAAARAEIGVSGRCLLVPGRLAREKGIDVLLHALAGLERSDVTLLLAGEGPERPRLAALAAALGITARVRFEGFQPEARMPVYYAAADLVCLPSREEGWPDALMESLACGCPFVASDVGGVPEIRDLTGDGIVVPPNDPRALAAALAGALTRDWDRIAIAARMAPHSLDATARRYVAACAEAAAA
jgi:teichuronic acid biosynthesis glycosyltransferase TuaC